MQSPQAGSNSLYRPGLKLSVSDRPQEARFAANCSAAKKLAQEPFVKPSIPLQGAVRLRLVVSRSRLRWSPEPHLPELARRSSRSQNP